MIRLLGTGGFSSVFLARDTELDVDVAVKVLADNLTGREEVVQAFLAEARLLRDVADSRVVAVHDIGQLESGQPYFVMDYVEGGSLAARLDSVGGRPGSEEILRLGRELALGLGVVHQLGIVHGDIKPENLFVRGTDLGGTELFPLGARLVLGDFGLATGAGDTEGPLAASRGYAPPEQLRGGELDPTADTYAATAVIRRVVTGRPPPVGGSGVAGGSAGLPSGLRAFCARGMSERRGDRYASAGSWAEDLEASLTRRRLWRRPLAWVVAATLTAAAVLGVVMLVPSTPPLEEPTSVAISSEGVLVADPPLHQVLEAASGTDPVELSVLVSDETMEPGSIAVGASGEVFVADAVHNRVHRIDPDGSVSSVAGTGEAGFGGDDGPAKDARLNSPEGVAVSDGGDLYIADTGNNRIRRVRADGVIETYAGSGGSGYVGDGSSARDAEFAAPSGLAVEPSGDLYIADTGNNVVRVVDAGGVVTTVAGRGESGDTGDGAPAVDALLDAPEGVATDGDGNVYVADTGNNRVRVISPDGVIAAFAGTGTAGFEGDGGPAVEALLDAPEGVAAGVGGEVYLADTGNGRLRSVSGNGVITTIAGG
ncbi:MAG: Serine/threonine-protein kinase PknD [Acidimicrobiales bacterium]|nr:Serine/threonine-protein kinase PknD [Acidimicrobiales bacterium]